MGMKKLLISTTLLLTLLANCCETSAFLFKKKQVQPQGQGYTGTLPNIEKYFDYKDAERKSLPQGGMLNMPVNKNSILGAPFDDDLFLDVIIKKDKTSRYVNDLHKILPVLEKFKVVIEKGADIQRFNANVNVLDLYVRNLEKNYAGKMESASLSYAALQEVNYRAKLLGNLKFDANYYSRFMPLDGVYSPESIAYHDQIMADELQRAIDLIKNEQ
ncbi:hypothetical protein tpqmel_0402 [Candidatus Gastranaerophilus sp. (ex Termes propinquus)]|nr:hypothetical protein tpqmel_0402 [Candidatus Gastranaerophilus sp. (ex Termes propinquus)]